MSYEINVDKYSFAANPEKEQESYSTQLIRKLFEEETKIRTEEILELRKQIDTLLKEETDPTVSSWAKEPTKPTYTAQEVGALSENTPIPIVDQTYNGESENAQSGKALKPEFDKVWPEFDKVWTELNDMGIALENNISNTQHLASVKANKSDVFTKAETEAEIKGNLGMYYTKDLIDTMFDNIYTKSETDTAIRTAILDSWEVPV